MKSSRLDAAKRIAHDQEDADCAALQRVAQQLREGSIDDTHTTELLAEAEVALMGVRERLDVLLRDGRDDLVARCLDVYAQAYETASEHVPLPLSAWTQWRRGIQALIAQPETVAPSSSTVLSQVREAAATNYEACFLSHFWGCQCALPARIGRCVAASLATSSNMTNAPDRDEDDDVDVVDPAPDEPPTSHDSTTTTLADALAPARQKWAALCYMSDHLASGYDSVGNAERTWLSEEVMTEDNDVQVETLMRQTFRRDLGVPCTALQQMWSEYEEFEVDDRKMAEMSKVFKATANSEWMRSVKKVQEHLTQTTAETTSSSRLDSDGNAEADALVRSWGTSSPKASLRALAFTMQRLVEWEAFPGVLNPSRLEFALHLLRSWLAGYTKGEHRWTSADPFTEKDDIDVWSFVLERHTALLRWSLNTAALDHKTALGEASSLVRCSEAVDRQIDTLRCVSTSVLQCLDVYRSNLIQSHAAREKVQARRAASTRLVDNWLQTILVQRFGAALLADLQRHVGACDEEAGGEQSTSTNSDAVDAALLTLEASLKLVLSQAQLFVADHRGVGIVRDRLEPLISDLLEGAVLRGPRLQRLTLSLINLYVTTWETDADASDKQAQDMLPDAKRAWTQCMRWYRRLLQVSTTPLTRNGGSDLFIADVSDAWMTTCRKAAQRFADANGTFDCAVQDVVYERRRALKRIAE